jgi:hypothetical protein
VIVLKWLIYQAVIDLAADIAHARAVVVYYKHLPTAGLVKIAPLRLALLEVLIHVIHMPDSGLSRLTFSM